MTPAARDRAQVRLPILVLSAAAWTWLGLEPTGSVHAAHQHHRAGGGAWWLPWGLMLVAMMAPVLAAPIRHVRDRSFAGRRIRSVGLFLAGYGAVWMAVGAILSALAPITPLAAALAIGWQFSPAKQRCLNRGHAHPELAAFGLAADQSALGFGLAHGFWCAGSCWALMLLPWLFAGGHLIAMAAVTLWIWGERLDRPAAPRWSWRFPRKAARLAAGQLRMQLSLALPARPCN